MHPITQHQPQVRGRPRAEPGSATLQMVILMPALFAVMFLGVQAALQHHARALAIAAAQEGARAAGAEHGTRSAGIQVARAYAAETAGDSLSAVRVTATRTATAATVTVTGHALSVIPGWQPAITQSATVTLERITR